MLTLEEADSKGLYIGPERTIESGDFERGWRQAEHRFEGTFSSKGQEQFYLESQAALAWPGEGDEIQLHSSTQNPTEIQKVVANVLGRKLHQVVCIVKRMGGAFGGKETQAALPALMAALTVDRTGRPARVGLARCRFGPRHHHQRSGHSQRRAHAGRLLPCQCDRRRGRLCYDDNGFSLLCLGHPG